MAARLTATANEAFVSGIHAATLTGAALAGGAAVLVIRFLPRHIAPEGAMHSPHEALENVAELGLGGVMPVFDDEPVDPSVDEPVAAPVPDPTP